MMRILAHTGLAAPQILRRLVRDFPQEAPSLRTVQRYLHSLEEHRDSEWWHVATADDEEAGLVLPVLGRLIRMTDNAIKVTESEASWIARVRRIAPVLLPPRFSDEDAFSVYLIACDYAERESTGQPTDDLDDFLALYSAGFEKGTDRVSFEKLYIDLVNRHVIKLTRYGHFLVKGVYEDGGIEVDIEAFDPTRREATIATAAPTKDA